MASTRAPVTDITERGDPEDGICGKGASRRGGGGERKTTGGGEEGRRGGAEGPGVFIKK